jgi:hypothetical protein
MGFPIEDDPSQMNKIIIIDWLEHRQIKFFNPSILVC